MKFSVFSILLILGCNMFSFAQTKQPGIVMEYNDKAKKTSLPGVSLEVKQAGSTISDNEGKFTLNFNTMKPGERLSWRGKGAQKDGYEIFNKDAVEQWNINPDENFIVVMCRSDKFKKICDTYYANSSANYKKQYEKEKNELERLKKEGKLKEEEYYANLRAAEELYEKQLENLDNYVDRFARIDLSELSAVEQDILSLVEIGKFDEAIAKYEEQNYLGKFINEIKDIQTVTGAMAQLADVKQVKEQTRDSLLAAIERQIETLKLAGGKENNQKIKEIYLNVADVDTTNYDWNLKTSQFLKDYIADFGLATLYAERAIQNAGIHFGEESVEMAMSLNNLGSINQKAGDFPLAFQNYNQALKILDKIYDEPIPEMISTLNNLGESLCFQGDNPNGLIYFQKALDMQKLLPEEDLFDKAITLNDIGVVYNNFGEYNKALQSYLESLAIREKIYPSVHPHLALSLSNIGFNYSFLGDYTKALEYENRAYEMRKKIYGESHPEVAQSLCSLATINYNKGNPKVALDYFLQAKHMQEEFFEPTHMEIGNTYNNIGNAYFELGDIDGAIQNIKEALDIFIYNLGEDNPNNILLIDNLAVCYEYQNDLDNAIKYFNKALEMTQNLLGNDNRQEAIIFNNLGGLYDKQGDKEKSLESYLKANKIYLDLFGEVHPEVALTYSNLAFIYSDLNQSEKAMEYIKKALEINKELYGENHKEVGYALYQVAMISFSNGDSKEALEYFLRAKPMIESSLESDHPTVKVLNENIEFLQNQLQTKE